MPSHLTPRTVRSTGMFVFALVVFSIASTMPSPGYSAGNCPCFSSADIVERCQVRASNALTESDRFLTLSCRPPSESNLIQRYVSGAYAVSNGVPVDWTCSKIRIPDDGSNWIREATHISKDDEQTCRRQIQDAMKTLVVKDDPERLAACAKQCTIEGMIGACRAFWNKLATEAREANEDFPQSELDEALANCDQNEPDTQKCKAECL